MLALERLARGNGSVGLGSAMHLISVAGLVALGDARTPAIDRVLRDVQHDGALINGLASEPDLGSPSRGGGFRTTATRTAGGWEISGRKTWSTLAPALTYGNVQLTVREADGSESRGAFIVPMASDGVRIEDTWDNLGMRATGSHDVVFDRVFVPDSARLPQPPSPPGANTNGHGLLTSAVYLGIAQAARDFAVEFARNRVPSGLGKPIAELESVQHKVARIEVLQLQARTVLYNTIEAWERYPELRSEIGWQFAAAKHLVTNHAIEVTDVALRIVGSVGLQRQHPLERFFRDVRAGLGNPPMDDVALTIIGKHALGVN
jgi:alkylation response protein AidB-like acyl-CoA dehydrogenase